MADRVIKWRPLWNAGATFVKGLLIPHAAGDIAGVQNYELWVDDTAGKLAFRLGGNTILVPLPSELSGGGLTQEQITDFMAAVVVDNADLDWTYDDAANGGVGTLVAVIKPGSVEYANIQDVAAARVLGRASGAGSGPPTELTGANILTILGAIDAATLGGDTKATIIASAVSAVLGGAGPLYDTLEELRVFIETFTDTAELATALAGRGRFFGGAIPSGAPTATITHGFTLTNPGDFIARCYVTASGYPEEYDVYPKVGTESTQLTVEDVSGANIPAGRRIFLTVGT